MDASEFWCRAFLAEMTSSRETLDNLTTYADLAGHYEKAADAALAVAQRRGMVAAPPERAPTGMVGFDTYQDGDAFVVRATGVREDVRVQRGATSIALRDGRTMRLRWSDTMFGRPVEVSIDPVGSGQAPGPTLERVEFTAERDRPWWLIGVHDVGVFRTVSGEERVALTTGAAIRIKWGETAPPKPIEVWIEKAGA